MNQSNFQELITQKLGASFLRYLPLNFLLKDSIFNDNGVIRNVFVFQSDIFLWFLYLFFSASWLHLLNPLQRDVISNKVYRSLTDTTGKIVQGTSQLRLTSDDDPSTLDVLSRIMPSLSTRQIINAIGDKIVMPRCLFYLISH